MRYIDPEQSCRRRIGDNEYPHWETAVMCFRAIRGSRDLIRALAAEPVPGKPFWGMGEAYGVARAHEATVNGKPVLILPQCIWGGPQAAILVEELAGFGCRNVIGYGSAGSIVPSLGLLQQIIVGTALPTDGTSRAYGVTELRADDRLLALAHSAANEHGIEFRPLCAATVDAPYRETPDVVETWRKLGAQAINMEASALYAAARACGMSSIWIGHISDRLSDRREIPSEGTAEASSVSADICRRLIELVTAQR